MVVVMLHVKLSVVLRNKKKKKKEKRPSVVLCVFKICCNIKILLGPLTVWLYKCDY